jgi:hypothetical protein
MPVQSYTVGPGTLSIGSVGTTLDLTAQVKSCRVSPKVNAEDATPTLSGEELAGERSYDWTLKATVIQELSDSGLIEFTWENAGSEFPFTFTPSTAAGKAVTGTLTVDPIELGGDARTKPTSDLEWDIVGTPAIGPDLT